MKTNTLDTNLYSTLRTSIKSIGESIDKPSIDDKYTVAFDNMYHAPLLNYLRREDFYVLYQFATNPKFSVSDQFVRNDVYDSILNPLGFVRSFSGTNRVVYSYLSDDTFLLKIGMDKVGINDNRSEFELQQKLKPFVPKIFDISPDGVVEMIEKVHPIMNRETFMKYAPMTFMITDYWVNHGLVMEDIGTDYFMNWGVRDGFGPVLLDFPYVYRLNRDRLHCNTFKNGARCPGRIIYDEGFNHLYCPVCKKVYRAKDVGSDIDFMQKLKRKEVFKMEPIKFTFTRGNKSVTHIVTDNGVDYINNPVSENITKNSDKQKYIENIKKKNDKKPNNFINKFSLNNAYSKTLEKLKAEYKIDNFNNKVIEYIANYLDVYHDQFILVPSVVLDSETEITDEIRESIKSKLSEDAGVNVTAFTEVNMGSFNMYIPSKPIINIERFTKCIVKAYERYLDEENEKEEVKEETAVTDHSDNALADAINEIANDKSVSFTSENPKKDKEAVTSVALPEEKIMNVTGTSNPLGKGVIDASDAIEVSAKQYGQFKDEF